MRLGLPEAVVICAVVAVFAAGHAVGREQAPGEADAAAARRAAYVVAFPLGKSQGARSSKARAKRVLGARDGRKAGRYELELRAEEAAREAAEQAVERAVGLRPLPNARSGGSGDNAQWTSPEGCWVDEIVLGKGDVRESLKRQDSGQVVTNPTRDIALIVSYQREQDGPRLRDCRRILDARLEAVP